MVNRQLKVLAALTASTSLANAELTVSETDAAITVTDGDNVVLAYHKAEVPPPEGADPAYHRSGFINPIRTPAGGVVTGLHPADHIHHLGIWHAWVKRTLPTWLPRPSRLGWSAKGPCLLQRQPT